VLTWLLLVCGLLLSSACAHGLLPDQPPQGQSEASKGCIADARASCCPLQLLPALTWTCFWTQALASMCPKARLFILVSLLVSVQ
jgi:hypothetical protein